MVIRLTTGWKPPVPPLVVRSPLRVTMAARYLLTKTRGRFGRVVVSLSLNVCIPVVVAFLALLTWMGRFSIRAWTFCPRMSRITWETLLARRSRTALMGRVTTFMGLAVVTLTWVLLQLTFRVGRGSATRACSVVGR